MKKTLIIIFLLVFVILLAGCTFVDPNTMAGENPDLFTGVWHGLIAPYTLVVRFFYNVGMYAYPNSGLYYDLGYLIGILFSLPIGWMAAIISVVMLFL
jgi:predicted small secreted protein